MAVRNRRVADKPEVNRENPCVDLAALWHYDRLADGSLALRFKSPDRAVKADALALASAEMGVLYCTLGMFSGSFWGREAWESGGPGIHG